jgi:hypothetical protein
MHLPNSTDRTATHARRAALKLRYPFKGIREKIMNWGQYFRHTAIAVGVVFLVAAGIYLAIRFGTRELE